MADKAWDLGGYLREQREHARLSVRQLANLAGVSNPYLSQVERGLRKPSAEVLQQIARGLRISAEALYVRAGILDSEGRPDVEAAVNADPDLNDRQRRVLLDIYASFRAENRRAGEAPEPEPEPVVRRRPAARMRSAAKTAKTATRGTARRATKKSAEKSAGAVPSTDSSTPSTSSGASTEPAAEPSTPARAPRKRTTARTARRATAGTTKAAPRAATGESDAARPDLAAAPDEHLS